MVVELYIDVHHSLDIKISVSMEKWHTKSGAQKEIKKTN